MSNSKSDFRLVYEQPAESKPTSPIVDQHGSSAESAIKSDDKSLQLPNGLTLNQSAFLSAFIAEGTISHAAVASGVHRTCHYDWLREPTYRRAFNLAKEAAADNLEREAIRRAVDGVEEPVYQRGELVAVVNKRSDALLMFLLKGARPDKFRERFDVDFKNLKIEDLSDEQLEAFITRLLGEAFPNDPAAAAEARKALEEGRMVEIKPE